MERLEPSAATTDSVQVSARQLDMDAVVGYILFYGVLLSLALVVIGLCWRWVETRKLWLDYHIVGMNLFQFVVSEVRMAVLGRVRPRLFINLGIAVLMLTPFLRVGVSVLYFLGVLKNWKYTLFTSFVLAVLTFSLFLR